MRHPATQVSAAACIFAASIAGASAESVRIKLNPSRVVLGSGRSAQIEVATPADVKTVSLSANVGRIEGVTQIGAGLFRANYVVPGPSFPQFAIIAAVTSSASGTANGWAVLPLWGRGSARVLGRPRAKLSLHIGELDFGPFVLDGNGKANVPVEVPPGVDHGVAGGRRVDLNVPQPSLVHLMLDRSEIQLGGPVTIGLRAYVLDTQGKPRPNARVEFVASRGEVGEISVREPGVLKAVWKLPPAGALGVDHLTARVPGETASAFTAPLAVVAGPPQALELTVARPSLVAGESEMEVSATARDAAGNLTRSTLELTANLGTGSDLRELEPGRYQGRWFMPARIGSAKSLSLSARVAGRPDIVARRDVPILPASPAQVRVAIAEEAPSRSGEARQFAVDVLDAFGNGVWGAPPTAGAELGQTGEVQEVGEGRYEFTYQAPAVAAPVDETLQVSIGDVRGETHLAVLPTLRRLQVAPKVGVLTNFEGGPALSAGGEVSAWVNDHLGGTVDVGWFFVSATPDELAVKARADFFTAAASITGRVWLLSRFQGSISVGGGAAAVTSQIELNGEAVGNTSRGVPFGQLTAGLSTRLWGASPFAEVRLMLLADPQLPSLQGSYRSLGLNVGCRFDVL